MQEYVHFVRVFRARIGVLFAHIAICSNGTCMVGEAAQGHTPNQSCLVPCDHSLSSTIQTRVHAAMATYDFSRINHTLSPP